MSRKIPGSAIVPGTITVTQISGGLNDTTNAAYSQANTARTTANDAYGQANTAYGQANNARSDANTTFATINTTFGTVNTSLGTINTNYQAAYSQANTARDTGNNAYASANLAYTQANNARSDANTTFATVNTTFGTINTSLSTINSSFSSTNTNYQAAYAQANTARDTANNAYNNSNTKLSTSGGSISGDLAITGNLTVQGNATTINVTNLSVNDSMILLSTGGVGDSNDVGFIGHIQRGATDTHVGLIRKATENRFYLFDNYEVEPTNNVIDVAGNNFRVGNLRLGIVNANSYVTSAGMDVTGQANAAYGQANAARSDANTTFATVNTTFGTINTNATNINSNALNAYASANLAYTQANTARSDANTTFATVNTTFATINTTTATMNTATSNRVLKAGDTMTGQLNISSGGLLVTGNVGIGTASPAAPLQVVGTGSGSVGTINMRGTNSHLGLANNTGSFRGWFGYFNSGAHGSETDLNIKTGYNGASNVRITADGDTTAAQLYIAGSTGNIGIGLTNPNRIGYDTNARVLTISGLQRSFIEVGSESPIINDISGGITFNSAANIRAAIYCRLDSVSNGSLTFLTGGNTERLRIDPTGNVGIGTTNPATPLHVVGNVRATRYTIDFSNQLTTFATVNPSHSVLLDGSPNDRDSWIFRDPADTGSNWGIYHRNIDSTVSGLPANAIGFIGGGASGLQAFISLANGNAFFNGRVGVGTNNPGSGLHVIAGSTTPTAFFDAATNGYSYFTMRTAGSDYGYIGQSSAVLSGGSSTDLAIRSQNSLLFLTNGENERVRITSGGVGIGTTNPGVALQVRGAGASNTYRGVIRIDNSSAQQWAGLSFPDSVTGSDVASNNYYFIGRGQSIADRVFSIHMPNAADYGSGSQPTFGVYSTGADALWTVQASTGNVSVKGNITNLSWKGHTFIPLTSAVTKTFTFTGNSTGSFPITDFSGVPSNAKGLLVYGWYHITGYGSGAGQGDHAVSWFGYVTNASITTWSGPGAAWPGSGAFTTEYHGSFVMEHDGDASGSGNFMNYYGSWHQGIICPNADGNIRYNLGHGLSGGTHYNALYCVGYWI